MPAMLTCQAAKRGMQRIGGEAGIGVQAKGSASLVWEVRGLELEGSGGIHRLLFGG